VLGEIAQLFPQPRTLFGQSAGEPVCGGFGDPAVGHKHGEKDHIDEKDHGHADAGADGNVLDHPDRDDKQGGKPDAVGEKGGGSRHENAPEGSSGRLLFVDSAAHLMGHDICQLGAVADDKGKN